MVQEYVLVVCDRIYMLSSANGSILEAYGCYYKSPVFMWDGSHDSVHAILDKYGNEFTHMHHWTAVFVPV